MFKTWFLTSYESLQIKGVAVGVSSSVHKLNIALISTLYADSPLKLWEDKRKHVKTGSSHESMSTCDFLSIYHVQCTEAESGHRTDYNTGVKTQSNVVEPLKTCLKRPCVVLHLKSNFYWKAKRQLPSSQAPYCQKHKQYVVNAWLSLSGGLVERQATMGVSSSAKTASCLPWSSDENPMVRRGSQVEWLIVLVSAGLMRTR